jgi:hypothetical protein
LTGKFGNKKILAYVHIEKCAGTTLINILRRSCGIRFMEVRPLSKNPFQAVSYKDLSKFLVMNPFLKVIGGHSIKPFSLSDSASYLQIGFMTLLRDPVYRYVSHYNFLCKYLNKNIPFEKFLRWEAIHNFQTKKIAGSNSYDEAKKIIMERFLIIGTVERFDEFLLFLNKRLFNDEYNFIYKKMNISSNKKRIRKIVNTYKSEIQKRNECDIELYRFVSDNLLKLNEENYQNDLGWAPIKRLQNVPINGQHDMRVTFDEKLRVAYEFITGMLRKLSGLPFKGSY